MKKSFLLAFLLLLFAGSTITAPAQVQQHVWYLPTQHINFMAPTAAVSAATPTCSSCQVTDGIQDANNNMLMRVADGAVYNRNGTLIGNLLYYQSYGYNTPALAIVPLKLECSYYIIYADYMPALLCCVDGNSCCNPHLTLRYAKVDLSANNGAGSIVANGELLSEATTGYGDFAIGQIMNLNGDRFLYHVISANPLVVKKYKVNNAGITYLNQFTVNLGEAPYDIGEVELSHDGKMLALTSTLSGKVFVIHVNPATGNLVTTSGVNGLSTFAVTGGARGLEFSPDNLRLYTTGSSGIRHITISSGVVSAALSGSSSCEYSYLELAHDGGAGYKIAAITSDNKLGFVAPLSGTSTFSNTGIAITTGYSYGGLKRLPKQIDGQNYTMLPLVNNFNINGSPSGNAPPQFLDVYTCGNILLNITSSGAAEYSLSVQSCDVNGSVISGGGYLNVNSTYMPLVSQVNLMYLPGGGIYAHWLSDPAHIGYYKVTLLTKNMCGDVSPAKVMYIKLNGPPSAANINFQINNSMTGVPCNSKTIATPCPTGTYSGSYNIGTGSYITNNISSYSRKIEEVNCSTGSVISLLYQDASPVIPANPSGSSMALGLNAINIGGNTGYFATHAVTGKCFKFTLTAYNACTSSASDWSYLTFDGAYKPGREEEQPPVSILNIDGKEVELFPNPVKDWLNIRLPNGQHVFSGAKLRAEVWDIVGRKISVQNLDNDGLIQRINMSDLPSGVYFLKISDGHKQSNNKFIK